MIRVRPLNPSTQLSRNRSVRRRTRRCRAGTRRYSRFSNEVMARSRRGSTQAGVRWNTVSDNASGCTSGTSCTADAPVPTTATRRPRRSASWSHRAEWKAGPANDAIPGRSGTDGSDSAPVAVTSTSAVRVPRVVTTSHRPAEGSQAARSRAVPHRTFARTPSRRATSTR